jgi:lipid-A-disaccharide synthase
MKYYLIAGERSGDLHGGNLIKSLRARDTQAVMRGFGGDFMQAAGMQLTVHYQHLAFMGVVAVLANLRTIAKRLAQCKKDIIDFQPDVVILIDYAGFNLRIARFAKQNSFRVYYYISPKVWAWNTQRAWKLKANVDRMFCILPFEKDFFKTFNWDVDYVGNPVLDAIKSFTPNAAFRQTITPNANQKKIIALLPGSRKVELARMLPLMAEVARRNPQYYYVVAAVKNLPVELYRPLQNIPHVQLVYEQTYDLLSCADAAIVTSGTATLETGLFRVPQAVIYRAAAIEYAIGIRFIKVKFISLVNLVANREVIKEFLQHAMTVENVENELKRLAEPGAYREAVLHGYQQVYNLLDVGSASENTAQRMIDYLHGHR